MTKYAKLGNDGNITFAPKNKNGVLNYDLNKNLLKADGYKEFIEIEKPQNSRKYKITYSETDENIKENIEFLESEEEYQQRKLNEETLIKMDSVKASIQEIDFRRIRALCEPTVKNEETGQTWLEYYNAQILELREQLRTLQERII